MVFCFFFHFLLHIPLSLGLSLCSAVSLLGGRWLIVSLCCNLPLKFCLQIDESHYPECSCTPSWVDMGPCFCWANIWEWLVVRLWCSQLRCILPPAENPEGPGQIFTQLQRCHLLLWRLVRSSQGSLLIVFLQVSQLNWPISASRECHNACLFLGQKKKKKERLSGSSAHSLMQ